MPKKQINNNIILGNDEDIIESHLFFYINKELYNKYNNCFSLFNLKKTKIVLGENMIQQTLFFKKNITKEKFVNIINIIMDFYENDKIIFWYYDNENPDNGFHNKGRFIELDQNKKLKKNELIYFNSGS